MIQRDFSDQIQTSVQFIFNLYQRRKKGHGEFATIYLYIIFIKIRDEKNKYIFV